MSITGESVAQPGVFTPKQLAEFLQISLRQVWVLRDEGALPPHVRVGRLMRWSRPAIESWLAAGNRPNGRLVMDDSVNTIRERDAIAMYGADTIEAVRAHGRHRED